MNEYISREAVINITAETGAWETQNRVRELPAADVRPVLHGKWVDEFYSDLLECFIATCSVCGCDNDSHLRISETHRFCKYCGSIMDLKDGDTND